MSEAINRLDNRGGVFAKGGEMKAAGYVHGERPWVFPNYLTDLPYPDPLPWRQPLYPVAPHVVQGEKLKVFAYEDGDMGVAYVIVAHSEVEAKALFEAEHGKVRAKDWSQVDIDKPGVMSI
jgi:hypothetical protein